MAMRRRVRNDGGCTTTAQWEKTHFAIETSHVSATSKIGSAVLRRRVKASLAVI